MIEAISVRQLNLYVKSLIEGDSRLACIRVSGEISNYKNHYASGHWYFTLKDDDAAIRCIMFRSSAARVKFPIYDGCSVTVKGRVSLYEKDGSYQLYAEDISLGGEGDAAKRFEEIKQRLLNEGLLEQANKRPIPKFPKSIAVVTSETGAAVQDILNILSRRWRLSEIIICPVTVQGEAASEDMIKTLERLYSLGVADLIIIGRGGGSAEDLSAFNDEALARKIYESPVPVISAVGHETDVTICDFVADLRAPTPSAAAELAVPESTEIIERLNNLNSTLYRALKRRYELDFLRFKALCESSSFRNPLDLVYQRELHLDSLNEKLLNALNNSVNDNSVRFGTATARLDSLSPLKVLSRGYLIAENNKGVVKSLNETAIGDKLLLSLADGKLNCVVEDLKYEHKEQ